MSAIAHSCAACGTDLPVGARFCASCGARTTPADRRVTWSLSEKRVFGVLPAATALSAVRGRGGRWVARLRARIRYVLVVAEARVAAGIARLRRRRDWRRLDHERARALLALGDAAYRDDRGASIRVRAEVAAIERRMEALNMELSQIDRREHERIAHAQMEGQPTNVVVPEPQPEPSEPPGPVIVPEPEPVPHEPPGPVIVPEPAPPDPTS
jgi:hypothetical protein